MRKNYIGNLKQLPNSSKNLTPEKAYILGVVGPGDGVAVCDTFNKVAGATTYEFEIDVQIVIPSDAAVEPKQAIITAGAEAV